MQAISQNVITQGLHGASKAVKIPLSQGQFALVDAKDYPSLSVHKWYFKRDGESGYAARQVWIGDRQTTVRMHRAIMDAPKGMEVDHKNLNKLDNRRQNLRICTGAENRQNRPKRSDNTSGHKNISWHKPTFMWIVQIHTTIKGRKRNNYIGRYDDIKNAIAARDKALQELHGEFAYAEY